MYVCICRPYTEKELRTALDDYLTYGENTTLKDFKKKTGICQQCCKCHLDVKQLWNRAKIRQAVASSTAIETGEPISVIKEKLDRPSKYNVTLAREA